LGEITDPGAKFENLIASHLLKWVHYRRDIYGETTELRYFRDTDRREVDFCLMAGLKPQMFIECKWSDAATSPHLHYLQKKFPEAEYYQVSATGKKQFISKNSIIHIPAVKFLQQLV